MIKLKDLIKENDCECGGDCCSTKESITENKNLKREFGEPLPTLSSVMKNHQKDKTVVTEQTEKKVADVSLAIAFPIMVLPVPGGPKSKSPTQGWTAKRW